MPKLLVIGGIFFAIAALLLGYLALTLYMAGREGGSPENRQGSIR